MRVGFFKTGGRIRFLPPTDAVRRALLIFAALSSSSLRAADVVGPSCPLPLPTVGAEVIKTQEAVQKIATVAVTNGDSPCKDHPDIQRCLHWQFEDPLRACDASLIHDPADPILMKAIDQQHKMLLLAQDTIIEDMKANDAAFLSPVRTGIADLDQLLNDPQLSDTHPNVRNLQAREALARYLRTGLISPHTSAATPEIIDPWTTAENLYGRRIQDGYYDQATGRFVYDRARILEAGPRPAPPATIIDTVETERRPGAPFITTSEMIAKYDSAMQYLDRLKLNTDVRNTVQKVATTTLVTAVLSAYALPAIAAVGTSSSVGVAQGLSLLDAAASGSNSLMQEFSKAVVLNTVSTIKSSLDTKIQLDSSTFAIPDVKPDALLAEPVSAESPVPGGTPAAPSVVTAVKAVQPAADTDAKGAPVKTAAKVPPKTDVNRMKALMNIGPYWKNADEGSAAQDYISFPQNMATQLEAMRDIFSAENHDTAGDRESFATMSRLLLANSKNLVKAFNGYGATPGDTGSPGRIADLRTACRETIRGIWTRDFEYGGWLGMTHKPGVKPANGKEGVFQKLSHLGARVANDHYGNIDAVLAKIFATQSQCVIAELAMRNQLNDWLYNTAAMTEKVCRHLVQQQRRFAGK